MKLLLVALLGVVVWCMPVSRRSYPIPEDKADRVSINLDALEAARGDDMKALKDRFNTIYNAIKNPSNGYFSPDMVPYHSIEELMCEAPDWGHETTSESMSYWIWLEALNIFMNDDFSGFEQSWDVMEKFFIPSSDNQPSMKSYRPESPATYAPEQDSPDLYPPQFKPDVKVGIDPLWYEITAEYDRDTTVYGMHWLLDVDNVYGFGNKADGTSKNVFINSFQRGSNESVWRTVPQPEWETFKWGEEECGFLSIFTDTSKGCDPQWRYTNAPDADARAIQAAYVANKLAKQRNHDLSKYTNKAKKMGDFLRYSMFDKYFKEMGCTSEDCPAGGYDDPYKASHYLLAWYYSWGGNLNTQSYEWAFMIGASSAHFGYQNWMAAYALSSVEEFISGTRLGKQQWATSLERQKEFYAWLQSEEGAIAGGATNSWNGRYDDAGKQGITGNFYGMAYDWQPVYHDPPSNQWMGMQCWGMQRAAEYYHETGDSSVAPLLDKWVGWVKSLKSEILPGNGDWFVPSTLHWEGQPGVYNAEKKQAGTHHVIVVDYSQDVGVGASLAHTLIFYAAAAKDDEAKTMARELLDRMWANYWDGIGVVAPEARADYIGNEWTDGFDEKVFVPKSFSGKYPSGVKIEQGATFASMRPHVTSNDDYKNVVLPAKAQGKAPVFHYHRFWAQAEYAIATADYVRVLGGGSQPTGGNVCVPDSGCNVCDTCCKPWITVQQVCDDCVNQACKSTRVL